MAQHTLILSKNATSQEFGDGMARNRRRLDAALVRLEKRLFPDPNYPDGLAPPIPPEPSQPIVPWEVFF